MIPDDPFIKLWVSVTAFILGLLFGMLRYAQEFLNPNRPEFVWWIAGIKGVTAGAVGWIAMSLAMEWHIYEEHPYLTGVVIAVSGWGGVDLLNAMSSGLQEAIGDYFRKRFGGKNEP